MRLATIRDDDAISAAVIIGTGSEARAVKLPADDVGDLLRIQGWRTLAERADRDAGHPLDDISLAAPIIEPSKIICLGLNYRSHILEMGRDLPTHPTLFAKWASTLVGPYDDIRLPAASAEVDWEAELAVVVGSPIARATTDEAAEAIAGYTVLNDVSMRDWQWRTSQWLQGKAFDSTTPVGPYLVTADEVDPELNGEPRLDIRCWVDGEIMQEGNTKDLLFAPAEALSYISQFTMLMPGDIVATGTPAGVGARRDPKRFLRIGDVLITEIEGLGRLSNTCVAEPD